MNNLDAHLSQSALGRLCGVSSHQVGQWLKGPFTARSNDGDGREIMDADGEVAAWCPGEKLAEKLAALMTLAA